MSKSLTPTCAALDAQQQKVKDDCNAADGVRRQMFEARDRLDGARADLRAEESGLAEAEAREANAVVNGSKDLKQHSADVAKGVERVARGRRVVNLLETKASELEASLAELERRARASQEEMKPLVEAAIEEIAATLLNDVTSTWTAAAAAQATYRRLIMACHDKGMNGLGERLQNKLNHSPAVDWRELPFPDWPAYFDRLATDASAQPPKVEQRQ